ncbi:MAG: formyltransferase family protein [Cyclobacteriaceae bacterium]
MRIAVLTQDDPFYLGQNLNYLFRKLSSEIEVCGCVVFDPSPFGKRLSLFEKVAQTIKIFGLPFFIHYALKAILNKLNPINSVSYVLRKNGVHKLVLSKNVNHPESIEQIKKLKPELLVSIAGNQIFKKALINLAIKGCINLHTSLLPKYRGLMPSFWVLKNHETETGVSVFFVDEGIDSGAIIVQKRVPITTKNQQKLIVRTKRIGMEALYEAIEKIHNGNVNLIDNPDDEMTYYSFPTKNDVKQFLAAGNKFY